MVINKCFLMLLISQKCISLFNLVKIIPLRQTVNVRWPMQNTIIKGDFIYRIVQTKEKSVISARPPVPLKELRFVCYGPRASASWRRPTPKGGLNCGRKNNYTYV